MLIVELALYKVVNKNGSHLIELLESYGSKSSNGRTEKDYPAQFTLLGALGNSVIDLGLFKFSVIHLALNFSAFYIVKISDHMPIFLEFSIEIKEKSDTVFCEWFLPLLNGNRKMSIASRILCTMPL